MAEDEDAVICDLAEVYGVFDYEALPPRTAAALFYGLPDDCRSKRAMAGLRVPLDTALLAIIADRLGLLLWQRTEDGQRNRNRPKSIAEQLLGEGKQKSDVQAFASAEDFEAARARILRTANP